MWMPSMTENRVLYRNFIITYEPPPIPVRSMDWQWAHEDYDGAPDSYDGRFGYSISLREAKADIDNWYEEQEKEQE